MKTYDFSPLFRSTVGFDRLLDLLDSTARPDWPPYNIEKLGEDRYRISMAVAGFAPDEVELVQQAGTLVITGRRKAEARPQELLHHGLASRDFRQVFNLADHVKVTSATLENGLLLVALQREIPEQLKPRRIEVGAPAAVGQDNRQQIAQDAAGGQKAA